MRNLIYVLYLLGLISLLSCNDPNDHAPEFNVGNSFTNSQLRVIEIDTLTLETSTMKFDSLVTSSGNRILIGAYQDPEFGLVRCASFFELLPNSFNINSEAIYDSIAMYMKYDKYYYNDTLQLNEIHVKRVIEKIKPYDKVFYNTSSLAFSN